MQDRRDFIKSSCSLCLGAIGLGLLVAEESCKPASAIFTAEASAEKVSVPLNIIKGKKVLVVKNPSMDNTILLTRKTEQEYSAVLMKCTHKGAGLELKGEQLSCPAHGSMFDFNGNVTHFPASRPLTMYPVELNGDKLEITLSKR